MTQSKAYNLKVFCDLKKIDLETEEAKEFLSRTFYEQLTIIKGLRPYNNKGEDVEEDCVSYSIIDRIIKK